MGRVPSGGGEQYAGWGVWRVWALGVGCLGLEMRHTGVAAWWSACEGMGGHCAPRWPRVRGRVMALLEDFDDDDSLVG